MTLADFALLVNASPKWLHNARAVLGTSLRYSIPAARRLMLARVLQERLGVSLPRAFELSAEALRRFAGGANPVTLGNDADRDVLIEIDVYRLLAALNVRLSLLRTTPGPRLRGRAARMTREPLRAAEEYGLDLSLLVANLRRTPAERLRQLDGMVDFRTRARRAATA